MVNIPNPLNPYPTQTLGAAGLRTDDNNTLEAVRLAANACIGVGRSSPRGKFSYLCTGLQVSLPLADKLLVPSLQPVPVFCPTQ